MNPTNPLPTDRSPGADPAEVPFSSNEMRLSPCQCLVALAVLVVSFLFIPLGWRQIEPLQADRDYRLPFSLGYDYWTWQRWCRQSCRENKILVLGDSVVWGHYVQSGETLSCCLNELAERGGGSERFANVGIDGVHPVALAGLVEYYGGAIRGQNVLLHLNLGWMSSKEEDLQSSKEADIKHPQLIPQFFPKISCYREKPEKKLAICVARVVPFFNWADHVRTAYFRSISNYYLSIDLPHWVIERPYVNPARAITLDLPSPDEPPSPPPKAKPWYEQDIPPTRFAWVPLDTSLQWAAFQRTVATLRSRGNRVFVLVGPLNEHMLTKSSLKVYRERQHEVEAWLQAQQLPYYIPPALPSHLYADASHPFSAEGYEMLARQLAEQDSFRDFRYHGGHAQH